MTFRTEKTVSLMKRRCDRCKEKNGLDTLKDLNVCSQKGLVEMFDGSIGAASVFMPHGGKYQKTETQAMVAKLPVLTGDCDTVTYDELRIRSISVNMESISRSNLCSDRIYRKDRSSRR